MVFTVYDSVYLGPAFSLTGLLARTANQSSVPWYGMSVYQYRTSTVLGMSVFQYSTPVQDYATY